MKPCDDPGAGPGKRKLAQRDKAGAPANDTNTKSQQRGDTRRRREKEPVRGQQEGGEPHYNERRGNCAAAFQRASIQRCPRRENSKIATITATGNAL